MDKINVYPIKKRKNIGGELVDRLVPNYLRFMGF